jgi:predicted phage-related endonuclease
MNKFKEIYYNLQLFRAKDFFYDLKYFFKNLWNFKKILWSHRNWDYEYCEQLYKFSLELLRDDIKNGIEEKRMATKKVKAIDKLIALLKPVNDNIELKDVNEYNKLYEEQLIKKYKEIYRLLVGQSSKELDKKAKAYKKKHIKDDYVDPYEINVAIHDGTGCENWWD